ncbi:Ribonuclease T2-like [Macleaya cordata]|uniref:Ribonuclease T2-like n=1 Tax=Macleaya cordata TaxID=56857 RepID=A0A200PPF8_MACCD|nr:Ribonuclease T2-like [Macleaya cordata]
MIRAYSQSSSPEKGFHFYSQMRDKGFRPDPISSSFVLKSCTRISSLVGGRQIHGRILRDGFQSDCQLLTTLMGFYASCDNGTDARKVFDEMPQRDTVAWNVLISCYARNGRTRDALSLFDVMQNPEYGSEPGDVTCLLLLQACAHLGALEFGERIHKYINDHGYGDGLKLCNSLIAMYSRCGCLDKAFEVFQGMPNKNVVSWSAMISGLAMNGHGRNAIEAFIEMQKMGISPDDQTFTGVLSACSHVGLVDEGMRIFESMREFGISPNIHHYGCMVDLLGRSGLLDQAYQLITSMGVKPDSTIWRTLLGACRIHGHVSLAERVVGHLIELKAQEAGDYVLLLNIYASVSDWEKVANVRRLMKEKGIQTTPGCSTTEINGEVHEFVVDDDAHPRKKEIYEMLDEIEKQVKLAGYVADMSAELHDLGAQEKGSALTYHSEKLAIAFGVLATPPNTKIRVAKNLRTCVDCHNFAKVVSSVYNRELEEFKPRDLLPKWEQLGFGTNDFKDNGLSPYWFLMGFKFLSDESGTLLCGMVSYNEGSDKRKPAANFGIHGLWPNYNDGSYPSNCDPDSPFDPSTISGLKRQMQSNWPTLACPSGDGTKFWEHEWEKHGTCSESVLDQEGYFEAALNLKKQVDLLSILQKAGIQPDGRFYSLTSITKAIRDATGYTPGIECNVDASGNSQLYQIYICVDTDGTNLIECPVLPRGKCSSRIEFPSF